MAVAVVFRIWYGVSKSWTTTGVSSRWTGCLTNYMMKRAETDVAAVFTVELIAVTDALTASFFDELLKRKTDFHDESIVGGIVDHCEQGELSGCPDRTN